MSEYRKRFIAGAICPQCQSQDTLQMWREGNIDSVSCVSCGHQQHHVGDDVDVKMKQPGKIIGIFTPQ